MDKCSVILTDIDGTLIDKGQPMVPITKQSLIEMHDRGVLLGLATGRKINKSMFERAKDWGLPFEFDAIIGMNGGQLWDRFHEGIESYYMLEKETMKEIISLMAPLKLNPMIYEEDHMVACYFDDMIHSSMKRNNTEVIITDGDTDRLCINENYNVLFRFKEERTEEVAAFEKRILREFRENHADILAEIRDTGDISDELSEKIKTVMDSVLENYRLVKGA
jgi:hydroxymethylpyrimidine pyrophosphatase-like HAD family hydrolase